MQGSVAAYLEVERSGLKYLFHSSFPAFCFYPGCRTFSGSGGIAVEMSPVVLLDNSPVSSFVFSSCTRLPLAGVVSSRSSALSAYGETLYIH